MDLSSLRRKARSINRFSISNTPSELSPPVIWKSLRITLPMDIGVQQNADGKVIALHQNGSAHLSGVIQLGDLVKIYERDSDSQNTLVEQSLPDDFVNVNIIYGVLQVTRRPQSSLMVEIGNRNNTCLGVALADSPGEKIRISSIQPGSLAERCGYLKPGDILLSVQVQENKALICSPAHTSFEVAQIIRSITSSMSTIVLTILPYEAEQRQLQLQQHDLFNMLSRADNIKVIKDEDNWQILTFSLLKDRLYEDWGFSLSEDSAECEGDTHGNKNTKDCKGSEILQIRPGGPAYATGLCAGDKIIQINDQDVSQLESTMLVPILASLGDSLNLTIIRLK